MIRKLSAFSNQLSDSRILEKKLKMTVEVDGYYHLNELMAES